MHGETIIYFDGKFWVGLFSLEKEGKITRVGKYIFGSEPTLAQLDEWMAKGFPGLIMTEVEEGASIKKPLVLVIKNPKRQLREAKREMLQITHESVVQKTMREMIEKRKMVSKHKRSANRAQQTQDRFDKRQDKKKKKLKGH